MADNLASGKLAHEVTTSVETRLSEVVIEHLPDSKKEGRIHLQLWLFPESHVLACDDQFSSDFLNSCATKVSDFQESCLKLKIVP